jgi:F-type H+-transporting ATPase subunit alpha
MRVSVSKNSLGCLVDCLGYIIISSKEKSTSSNSYKYKVERPAPGITQRESIYQPLHTGNILVDSLFPIGRGQRELILGDRQTGKTTVAVNAILTQK